MLDDLKLDKISIMHHIDALGCIDFLKISDSLYPEVIQAFYCKTQAFVDKSLLVLNLKSIEIRLTSNILAKILQLLSEDPTVFGKDWYFALNISKYLVFQELFILGSTDFFYVDLKPLPKVFNNIKQHSILPHYGSHEFVFNNDALIIYHLLHRKRLNLPHIFIQNMITFPYGMVLTRIFRCFNIPLTTETSIFKISKFSSNNISHMKKINLLQHPSKQISPYLTKKEMFH